MAKVLDSDLKVLKCEHQLCSYIHFQPDIYGISMNTFIRLAVVPVLFFYKYSFGIR